jgi:hypothetical protein
LSTFSGEIIPTIGQCSIKVKYNNNVHNINFHVVDLNCQNILGCETCKTLNLTKRVNKVRFQLDSHSIGRTTLFDQNKDLFKGLGCVSDYICKVEEPTEWVSAIVLTSKINGKIRLSIDPHKLNQAIMRPHYQFPTLDEIKAYLSGAKFFTTLDANKGFWMLNLIEALSMLCTLKTHFGRY